MTPYFMSATGIENSAPMVAGYRIDQLTNCGYYHLDRNIRPVGVAVAQLNADWQHVLPTQSVGLVVPGTPPRASDHSIAARRCKWLRILRVCEVRHSRARAGNLTKLPRRPIRIQRWQ